MSRDIFITLLTFKIASVSCYSVALLAYKPRQQEGPRGSMRVPSSDTHASLREYSTDTDMVDMEEMAEMTDVPLDDGENREETYR
jgi:hypothetical protein